MFKGKEDQLYHPRNLFIWFLLAFQGGALNTAGYLAVHRFVSHVTGFATLAGVAGAQSDWKVMLGMLMVPICFLLGVIISAWNVERRRINQLSPRYSFVFSVIIFNIFIIAVAGVLGYFGNFGEALNSSRDYVLLFILSFTCGLQNAVISSASGAVIRTTHLTGLTTDFGIGLVRIWSNLKNPNTSSISNYSSNSLLSNNNFNSRIAQRSNNYNAENSSLYQSQIQDNYNLRVPRWDYLYQLNRVSKIGRAHV